MFGWNQRCGVGLKPDTNTDICGISDTTPHGRKGLAVGQHIGMCVWKNSGIICCWVMEYSDISRVVPGKGDCS